MSKSKLMTIIIIDQFENLFLELNKADDFFFQRNLYDREIFDQ